MIQNYPFNFILNSVPIRFMSSSLVIVNKQKRFSSIVRLGWDWQQLNVLTSSVCLPFHKGWLQRADCNPKQGIWVCWNYHTGKWESETGDRVDFFRTLTSNLSRELWTSLLQKIVLAMLDNVTDVLLNSWVHFSHRWCSKLQFSHL